MITASCHCGLVTLEIDAAPTEVTQCNCSICRRYGVLWAYDWDGEGIRVSGPTHAYLRGGRAIEFHFCPTCGCVGCGRAPEGDAAGRKRIAVNLRLADPDQVATIPIDRFDGLATFTDLPRDGRCVGDVWF